MPQTRLHLFAAAALLALAPGLAHAAGTAPNGWVSSTGTDTAGCGPVTVPCRTFQYVHDNVVGAGGEIRVKDAGGFGQLVITKSLSVVNDGAGLAGISAPTGTGILIQAGAADKVFIKGLTIDGLNTGANGISMASGASLTVTDSTIKNFLFSGSNAQGNGILVANLTGTVTVTVVDTVVTGNTNIGVLLFPGVGAASAGSIRGVIKNLVANGNRIGFAESASNTTGTIKATVIDSIANGNTFAGFAAEQPGASLAVSNSAMANNGTDLASLGSGVVTTYQNNIYATTTGVPANASLH